MDIEEIRKNAPEGANGYEVLNNIVFYFMDDFWIWQEGIWQICIFNEGYESRIKPL